MNNGDSRTADKFVIRYPEGMRALVSQASFDGYMSMNTYVIQAIAEKLDRDKRQELLLDVLVAAARRAQMEPAKE